MERNIDMNEVSDGRLYDSSALVRIGSRECEGCSQCCKDVGTSILLDPYDFYELEKGRGFSFEDMYAEGIIELNVIDGVIIPNLKTPCKFLNDSGRCSIHDFRPGFCRLYPLGRIYNDESFDYFLQVHECPFPNKTKVRIKDWLGIPHLPVYEEYIKKWHFLLKNATSLIRKKNDDELTKKISMMFLTVFFVNPYNTEEDFFPQFYERLSAVSGSGDLE